VRKALFEFLYGFKNSNRSCACTILTKLEIRKNSAKTLGFLLKKASANGHLGLYPVANQMMALYSLYAQPARNPCKLWNNNKLLESHAACGHNILKP
jgi:hypothetical protein